ncbi:MAG TPA: tetratricopeptide repeat protein [Isosphaeraceae bacterium]|nr:tetratricopeptide repeat protein [Isosphaeraceae bacterium]
MDADGLRDSESLALSLADKVDAACDRYEADWKAGGRPRIEEYLENSPEPARPLLLRELLVLELELRAKTGESPAPQEYHDRFPDQTHVIESVFSNDATRLAGEGGADSSVVADFAMADWVGDATSAGRRFHILRHHAAGGLGEVFVARDEEVRREVALKTIRGQRANDPQSRARFLQEAEITGGLEHPGIVPVYGIGHDAGGHPFYAMRFIRGDSLRQAITRFHEADDAGLEPGERALQLRNLLSSFVDVCNAIAYAHSRGVLHRDLKPANIMLGKFGETLVVDWGLAKSIGPVEGGHEGEEQPLIPEKASGSAETMPGSQVGTPAYMSPEQASGLLDELCPESDVYSLGATLYCILTGESPVSGPNLETIFMRVRTGDFPPPRQVKRSVPAALEAICLKAMALAPKDRYPSARALAEDIKRWFANERVAAYREPLLARAQRWGRRHKAIVAGALVLVATGFVALALSNVFLGWERERTEQQRRRALEHLATSMRNEREANLQHIRADSNGALARGAVNDFLFVVSENTLLRHPGLQPLRRQLLEKGLAYYKAFVAQVRDDPALQKEVAGAYIRVARITDSIGSKTDALAAYKEAVAIEKSLAQKKPADSHIINDMADNYTNMGTIYQENGQRAQAVEAYGEAAREYARLLAAEPKNADYLNALTSCYNNSGHLEREVGRFEEAARSFGRAAQVLESVVAAEPGSKVFLSHLASTYNNIGLVERNMGNPDEAMRMLEKSRTMRQGLLASSPNEPSAQTDLAQSFHNIGMIHEEAGKLRKALEFYRQSCEVFKKLAAANPAVTDYQYFLAVSESTVGLEEHTIGQPELALRSLVRAREILRKLLAVDAKVIRYQNLLGNCLFNIGVVEQDAGHSDEARRSFQEALEMRDKLASAHPEVGDYQKNLGDSISKLGEFQKERGQSADAVRSFERALAIREALVKAEPNKPAHLSELAETLNGFGRLERELGRAAHALDLHKRDRDLLTKLVAAHPESPEFQSSLAAACDQEAADLAALDRLTEAVSAYRKAIDVQRDALKEAPEMVSYRRLQSDHYLHLGRLLRSIGRLGEAAAVALEHRLVWTGNPGGLYDVARELANDIPQAAERENEAVPKLRKRIADWAIEVLHEAVAAGFRDGARMNSDKAFDTLRSRSDFQAILSDIAFPAQLFEP